MDIGAERIKPYPRPPYQYANSHHCFPYISYGTYEENLLNNQEI